MKRNRMVKFSIGELSGVDVPAQEGAQALILKRRGADDPPGVTRKGTTVQAATDSTDGHQHGIEVSIYNDKTHLWITHAVAEGADTNHDHQLIMGADGTYTISENAGHTHTVDDAAINAAIATAVAKSQSDPEGPVSQKELDALKKQNERLGKIVALDAATKAYYDTLEGEEAQDAFLAKSAEDRAAEIKKAEDDAAAAKAAREAENPEVYKTKSGISIRQSDGAAALALAKQADEDRDRLDALTSENDELRKSTADADYMKQARTEFAHLPGTAEETAAHLKAIDGIEDEDVRKRSRDQLRQQNAALAPFFKGVGTDTGHDVSKQAQAGGADDASTKLDELTKEYMEKHPDVTEAQASAAVMETPEGIDLYTKIAKGSTHTVSAEAA